MNDQCGHYGKELVHGSERNVDVWRCLHCHAILSTLDAHDPRPEFRTVFVVATEPPKSSDGGTMQLQDLVVVKAPQSDIP